MINNWKSNQRRKLEFHLATKKETSFSLNYQANRISESKKVLQNHTTNDSNVTSNDIKIPNPGLFDKSLLQSCIEWKIISSVGPGFYNFGNTCFLNSTLQCLVHLPIFAQVLVKDMESKQALNGIKWNSADNEQRYVILQFRKLLMDIWNNSNHPSKNRVISPKLLVQNIRKVGKQFRHNRQEDAHEYLVQLLDCMHEEILKANSVKLSDGRIAETTVISRIFGGYLCNELRCPSCKFCSKTYNHYQSLSLDVNSGISSINSALHAFLKPEQLTSGNEWKCEGCNKKVKATKQLIVEEYPSVLVLHLKRFSYGFGQSKINKHIEFEELLHVPSRSQVLNFKNNKQEFTNVKSDLSNSKRFHLCGIIVHHGSSVHSGHYVAYVKAPNKQWYEMNDTSVSLVSIKKVLQQQAYTLFYSAENTQPSNISLPIQPKDATIAIPSTSIEKQKPNPQSEDIGVHVETIVSMKSETEKMKQLKEKVDVPTSNYDKISETKDDAMNKNIVDSYVSDSSRLKKIASFLIKPLRFQGRVSWIYTWKKQKNWVILRNSQVQQVSEIQTNEKTMIDERSADHMTSVEKHMWYNNKNTLKKNNDIDIDKSNKASDSFDISKLIHQSYRGKNLNIEGSWDQDINDNDLLEKSKSINRKLINEEKSLISSRKVGELDYLLDLGRKKKVKITKPEEEHVNTTNKFQEFENKRQRSNN